MGVACLAPSGHRGYDGLPCDLLLSVLPEVFLRPLAFLLVLTQDSVMLPAWWSAPAQDETGQSGVLASQTVSVQLAKASILGENRFCVGCAVVVCTGLGSPSPTVVFAMGPSWPQVFPQNSASRNFLGRDVRSGSGFAGISGKRTGTKSR